MNSDDPLPHTPMGAGAEFDSIRRMLDRWGPAAKSVGDDAAVITGLGERALVASTDTSVENVHFRREWLTPAEIGYRSAVSALSDLAAMGARPVGMLVAMGMPEGWRAYLDQLSDGIGEAAILAEAPVIGGDMSRASELSLTFTVLGTARDVLLRTGARPGDSIYLTGSVGAAGGALTALQHGLSLSPEARQKFVRPVARIREAAWLAEQGATSAIDISDGLAQDLGHIAAASRACLTIDVAAVPIAAGVSRVLALGSGEEYEIVVTSSIELNTVEFEKLFSVPLTRIGMVSGGSSEVIFMLDGERVEPPSGYLHFS